ncbi:MAG TPA: glycosyltransferase [Bryobacteraceae bacterium]|nr:glycosyltransferase [Bryobacteraceae bacterium]
MRIVLLTTNLARGGAEAQVAQLAAGLLRRGHEAAIVSLLEPSAFTDTAPVESLGMSEGVADPRGMTRLVAILRRRRPQVLHSHLFHANLMARFVRLVCPVRAVVSTLHSISESGRASTNVSRRDRLYRLTDPLADAAVAVSKAVADRHAAARAVSPAKLRVIHNGVDTGLYHPDEAVRERVRAELGIRSEFVWLAVGRLMWKKDYTTLLSAFSSVPGTLLVAGEGPQEAELRAAAGLNVRFLGARGDVPALMQAADAFVLSSVVEGLPVVLLEAAASALPCVATDVGGVREVVPGPFVVPPGDSAALCEAMRRIMLMRDEERRAIGEALRALAQRQFDIETCVSEWEALYRELLAWT